MASRVHYKTVTVDLAAATSEPKEVFSRDLEISDVGVLRLPAAAAGNVFLHLGGPNADPIDLMLEGQNLHVETEPDKEGVREGLTGGVFVSIPAAIGGPPLKLLIGLTVRLER